jgi:copper chaperone NosL
MKTFILSLIVLLLIVPATILKADAVEPPQKCQLCNMDRTMFGYSRMVVEYSDGTTAGVCSLHCAVADQLNNKSKQVKSMKVADYNTKELIDAKTATWVVGGKIKGVMTAQAKWAFAKEQDAKDFIKKNGGDISSFDNARKITEKECIKMMQQ